MFGEALHFSTSFPHQATGTPKLIESSSGRIINNRCGMPLLSMVEYSTQYLHTVCATANQMY